MADKGPGGNLSELTKLLAGCGVALVLLPPFPSAGATGATFWLRAGAAVLLISSRDMGADIFWPRLFHGIGHLLLHKRTTFICGGNADPEFEAFEKEANDFAANRGT
jgi:HTH-type transcriptional regulator / antitoxin HigA